MVYSNSGERSAAGAFLLGQVGIENYILAGGLSAYNTQARPPTGAPQALH